jgi:hypothetical protein
LLESREELRRLLGRLRNNEPLTVILYALRNDSATAVMLQRDYGVAGSSTDRSPTDDLLGRYGNTSGDHNVVEVQFADALRVVPYVSVSDRRERAANLLRSFVTHVHSLTGWGHLEQSLEQTIGVLGPEGVHPN